MVEGNRGVLKEEASGRCDICYINEHDLFEHPGAPLRDLMLWVRGSAVDEAVEFAHTHVDTAYLALLFDDIPTAMLTREKFIEQGSFWAPVCVAEDDGRFSIVIWDELREMRSLYQRVLDIVQEEKLRLRAADDGTLERIETALVKMAPEEGVHVSNDRICIFDPETGKTLRSWANPSPEMRSVALAVRDFYTETEN